LCHCEQAYSLLFLPLAWFSCPLQRICKNWFVNSPTDFAKSFSLLGKLNKSVFFFAVFF
jgi:hypothetical protein